MRVTIDTHDLTAGRLVANACEAVLESAATKIEPHAGPHGRMRLVVESRLDKVREDAALRKDKAPSRAEP